MATLYRGIGKVRAHGKARIAITLEARDEADFLKRWHKPVYDYPFEWESGYKYCIEYKVEDFAAEVGFYIDILGITVDSISPSRAQFSSPDQELVLAVSALESDLPASQPNNLRLQMFIQNIEAVVTELGRRGVIFEQMPEPSASDASLLVAAFQTPNGMTIELWGYPSSSSSDRRAGYGEQVELEEEVEDEYEDDDDSEDPEVYSTPDYRNPRSLVAPLSTLVMTDDLDGDEEQLEESPETAQPGEEDQPGMEMGYDDNEQDDPDAPEPENEDEDARLNRFLEASRRPIGYTFDERVEPINPSRVTKPAPESSEVRSNSTRRSGRTPAQTPAVNRRRMLPSQRITKRPPPTVIEPTYDDIEEADQIP